MLFEQDSDFDLLLAVAGTALILVFALGPVAKLGPPWGPLLAIAAGWPAIANLLRYKRAPLGCAVVPVGILLWAVAFLAQAPLEVQGLAILLPNLPYYLWVSLVKPVLERRSAFRALDAIKGSEDPALWAGHLEHPAPGVRHAAAKRLGEKSFEDVGGVLEPALKSESEDLRGAAAVAIRSIAERDPEAAVAWLRARASDSDAGLPAAGLLAEQDPREGIALLRASPSTGLRLAVAEGILHREQSEEGERLLAVDPLIEVLGQPDSAEHRSDAYYLALRFSGEDETLQVALREALRGRRGHPSVEELALYGEVGIHAKDALRCARSTGDDDYDLAAAALEAVEAIVRRQDDALGPGQPELVAALQEGHAHLRRRHPAGENQLADQLVDRLETLIAALGTE